MAGAKVVAADIAVEADEQTVGLFRSTGGSATFVQTDVADEAHVERMVAATIAEYGRLDYAFNNAGGYDTLTWAHPSCW